MRILSKTIPWYYLDHLQIIPSSLSATAPRLSVYPTLFYGRMWALASFLKRPVPNVAGESDKNLEEKSSDDQPKKDEVMPHEIGNGGYDGEVVLGDVPWGERALSVAHEVLLKFGGDIKLYSFVICRSGYIHVILDKLSDKYGFPSREDLEYYSHFYKKRLVEIQEAGEIPNLELSLRVTSTGFNRVLKAPDELVRFKDLLLKVWYVEGEGKPEQVGIFKVVSVETKSGDCELRLLNVKENRDLLAKGRPLSYEQRQWRLRAPFRSLKKVILY